jgi:hypothetical protein
VVAGAGRDDDHRRPVPGGHGCDQRLRAVASRHADDVRPAGDRGLGQGDQVVPRLQHDRFDATCPALDGETDAVGFPAAAARVDQQHGLPGRRDGRPCRPNASSASGPATGDEPGHRPYRVPVRGGRIRGSPHPTMSPTVAPIAAPTTTSPA